MSSTEAGVDSVRAVAGALFDELVVPLAEARKAAGRQSYFPLKGESGAKSYYVAPLASVMKPADFEFPGGGTADGLIDALTAYWADQGQTELAALAPGSRKSPRSCGRRRPKATAKSASCATPCFSCRIDVRAEP